MVTGRCHEFSIHPIRLAEGKAAIVYNGEWIVGELVTKYRMKPEDIGAFVIPLGDRDVMAVGLYT
ncbi:hypothetical protein KZ483_02070 [Paenibacillus sp. sptzw28]|uniref:hypothetical protein n=1 Tax=Paenibacillus sp. sptzw28 TaxID=715179 RepID=UPI001C6E7CD2|nr:hypothetical protein [Paenibacillus sp. sptzw28]QYR21852.1 hypothetical protein KZ483_02070 [Paenibacillus sp. sptzw28]